MKKIIVTAPTSVVSREFIKFVKRTYEITTVGRRESDITFDFAENTDLILPAQSDAIVHFAGMLSAQNDKEVLQMVNTNVSGIIKLCTAAKKSKARQIIYISSIFATLQKESPYYSYYALTKRQAEETARLYCRLNHIPLCIIRPSQLFGTSTAYAKAQPLLYIMLKNAAEGNPITIYGKNDALRNYIFADNLHRVIFQAIERCSNETIDVIDSKNYRISEVAKCIASEFGNMSRIQFLGDKPDIADNAFSTETNYFLKWGVPFISFDKAICMIAHTYKDIKKI